MIPSLEARFSDGLVYLRTRSHGWALLDTGFAKSVAARGKAVEIVVAGRRVSVPVETRAELRLPHGSRAGAILGCDFARRYRWLLDYRRGEVRVVPAGRRLPGAGWVTAPLQAAADGTFSMPVPGGTATLDTGSDHLALSDPRPRVLWTDQASTPEGPVPSAFGLSRIRLGSGPTRLFPVGWVPTPEEAVVGTAALTDGLLDLDLPGRRVAWVPPDPREDARRTLGFLLRIPVGRGEIASLVALGGRPMREVLAALMAAARDPAALARMEDRVPGWRVAAITIRRGGRPATFARPAGSLRPDAPPPRVARAGHVFEWMPGSGWYERRIPSG